ncbi:MAG: hypothetical protein D6785_15645, partial [Planctomycetota bacterium]
MVRKWYFYVVFFSFFMGWMPSSLEAGKTYYPNLTHRPRLAFDGRDQAHIQRVIQRLQNNEKPWSMGYQVLYNWATQKDSNIKYHNTWKWHTGSDPYLNLYNQEVMNSRIARAKAAIVWFAQQGYNPHSLSFSQQKKLIQKSGELIRRMYRDWPVGSVRFWEFFKVANRGIVAAAALIQYLEAYDFMMALPTGLKPNSSDIRKMEDNMAEMASDFYFWFWSIANQKNNHGIRTLAALGIAAICLNHYNRGGPWHSPKKWMAKAVRELHPVYGSHALNTMKPGCYTEGSSYYHYAADLYMPFCFSYLRFHRGQGVPFLKSNLYTNPTMWLLKLQLPDGRRPVIDNSRYFRDIHPPYFLSRIPGGARSFQDQKLFYWDWKRAGYPGVTSDRGLYIMAAFDPTPQLVQAAESPSFVSHPFGGQKSFFLKKEGEAALRTGWSKEDSWAMVIAENGDARKHGRSHESVDNGSFSFYANKDLIVLAPGYDGFKNVTKTNRAEHQSMILINGKGPKPASRPFYSGWKANGEDAFIQSGSRTFDNRGNVSSVEVYTEYEGAKIWRTVLLVDKSILVVEDRIEIKKKKILFWTRKPKKYIESLVQLNGSASKGGALVRQGSLVRFYTKKRKLPVSVNTASTNSIRLFVTNSFDNNSDQPRGNHYTLHYKTNSKVRENHFLTVLAAGQENGTHPVIQKLALKKAGSSRNAKGLAVKVALPNGDQYFILSNPKN